MRTDYLTMTEILEKFDGYNPSRIGKHLTYEDTERLSTYLYDDFTNALIDLDARNIARELQAKRSF